MMSHCKNNFNGVLFPKHWKVLAFVISFSLTGAKTLESMGLLSSWCASVQFDENLHCNKDLVFILVLCLFLVQYAKSMILIGQVKVIHLGLGTEDVANFMTGFSYGIGSSGLPMLVDQTFMRVLER